MFQRCVVVVELDKDVGSAVRLAWRLTSEVERFVVLAYLPLPLMQWFQSDPWEEIEGMLRRKEEELLELRGYLPEGAPLEVRIVTELGAEVVSEALRECGADLAVMADLSLSLVPRQVAWLREIAASSDAALAWLPQGVLERDAESLAPVRRLLCVGGRNQGAGLLSMLRMRSTEQHQIVAALVDGTLPEMTEEQAAELMGLVGIRGEVEIEQAEGNDLQLLQWVMELIAERQIELVCASLSTTSWSVFQLPFLSWAVLAQLEAPLLCVPFDSEERQREPERILRATDVLWLHGFPLLLYLEQVHFWGAAPFEGRLTAPFRGQEWRLDFEKGLSSFACPAFVEEKPQLLGVGAPGEIEWPVRILHHEGRPVVLFDLSLSDRALKHLASFPEEVCKLGVRLLGEDVDEARKRLQECGLTPWLFEASQLLDDGSPTDLPPGTEGLRLYRVALRLRAQGVQVYGIFPHAGIYSPRDEKHRGFSIVKEEDPHRSWSELEQAFAAPVSLLPDEQGSRGSFTAFAEDALGGQSSQGNRLQWQLDNQKAREQLIGLCHDARFRIHIQVYIVHDDESTQAIEEALKEAGGRGVEVRILVDSLYSLHGSFRQQNTWLQRVSELPGVQLRVYKPIEGLPDLESLKQRDHRKFVIVDGCRGVVTGRNFGASYYRDFWEVELAPETPELGVPWMDAGAAVEGPICTHLDAAFLEAWQQSGGEAFELLPAEPVGDVACQLLLHRGLRDTYTLDAQLALIRRAQKHLILVNTFPLLREFQHVLLKAIERGIEVRFLSGNVRPMYLSAQGELQAFPGNPLRDLAMQVIYSRLDRLIEAGASVYEYELGALPHWDDAIASIRPHVHAKILTCDGEVAAVGSANFDVTGAFWECEALLLTEDARLVLGLEAELHHMMEGSRVIKADAPHWREKVARRQWLDRFWPSILA